MHLDAQVSDRALTLRVLDGDPRAADLFVARFTRLVWWILIHQIRLTAESAEDVYQDIFIHLWDEDYRRLRNWSGEGDFSSYLAPIVRHRALDRLRRARANREQPLPAIDETGIEPAAESPSPEELAYVAEQRKLLELTVAALAARDRDLYERRFVQEQSYREIAAACDITVTNVGVRLNRLVERLRAAIAEDSSPTPPRAGDAVRSPGPGPSTN